jgi:Holliday junction resolvasome RuvABC endonuclease subunit
MSNFGMVKGHLDMTSGAFFPDDIQLIETKPDTKNKKTVRKNSDDLNRAKAIFDGMTEFIADVEIVFVEIPVGSQSARAMASYGMCIGILSSIQKSFVQVTPLEVKIAATGKKTATKAEMINWATTLYSKVNWFTRKLKGVETVTNKNEHLADAIAAIHAGCKTEQFKQMQSMHKLFKETK